jgi:hypothetical protein
LPPAFVFNIKKNPSMKQKNRHINADLILLALLQQEQIMVEIEIAQIFNRPRRRRRRPKRHWVQPDDDWSNFSAVKQTVA